MHKIIRTDYTIVLKTDVTLNIFLDFKPVIKTDKIKNPF